MNILLLSNTYIYITFICSLTKNTYYSLFMKIKKEYMNRQQIKKEYLKCTFDYCKNKRRKNTHLLFL